MRGSVQVVNGKRQEEFAGVDVGKANGERWAPTRESRTGTERDREREGERERGREREREIEKERER